MHHQASVIDFTRLRRLRMVPALTGKARELLAQAMYFDLPPLSETSEHYVASYVEQGAERYFVLSPALSKLDRRVATFAASFRIVDGRSDPSFGLTRERLNHLRRLLRRDPDRFLDRVVPTETLTP